MPPPLPAPTTLEAPPPAPAAAPCPNPSSVANADPAARARTDATARTGAVRGRRCRHHHRGRSPEIHHLVFGQMNLWRNNHRGLNGKLGSFVMHHDCGGSNLLERRLGKTSLRSGKWIAIATAAAAADYLLRNPHDVGIWRWRDQRHFLTLYNFLHNLMTKKRAA